MLGPERFQRLLFPCYGYGCYGFRDGLHLQRKRRQLKDDVGLDLEGAAEDEAARLEPILRITNCDFTSRFYESVSAVI
jgi:hypothetical protein